MGINGCNMPAGWGSYEAANKLGGIENDRKQNESQGLEG